MYLKNPALYIKGIKKGFLKGFLSLDDPKERADLITYMADYYR
jgi:cytochrome c2